MSSHVNSAADKHSKIICEEQIKIDKVNPRIYLFYLEAFGIKKALVVLSLALSAQGLDLAKDIWLSKWSGDSGTSQPATTNGHYLAVYGVLGTISSVLVMGSCLAILIGGVSAAKATHSSMLGGIFKAPMSFFEMNPGGRVVNRFSKDVDIMDQAIPSNIMHVTRMVLQVTFGVVGIGYTRPILLVFIVPLFGIYWLIQSLFIRTSSHIKRMESSKGRSLTYSLFRETLNGLTTIRAYGLQETFMEENAKAVDKGNQFYYCIKVTNRWLHVRLSMLSILILFAVCSMIVIGKKTLSPELAGLSLTYALNVTGMFMMLIIQVCLMETNMVSVERTHEYAEELPREAPFEKGNDQSLKNWPQKGRIAYKDLYARYRPGSNLVLHGLSFSIDVCINNKTLKL